MLIKKINNRNILFIYLSGFFGNGFFERAIFILYLLDQGYTLLQIGFLQSLVNLAMFVFEIPTGIFADRFGRKNSLIFGRVLIMVYFVGMVFADHFSIVAAAFIALGIGVTFLSGTEEALLFDSAKKDGKEKDFTRIAGRYGAIITLILAIAMALGGYLKEISWSTVFIVSIAFQVVATILTLFIKEVEFDKPDEEEKRSFTYFLKETATFLRMNKASRMLILGIALFDGVISIYLLFVQQILNEAGYAIFIISSISAVITLISAFASDRAHVLENRFSPRIVLMVTVCFSAIFFLMIYSGVKVLLVVAFLGISLSYYLFAPVSNTLINMEIPSEQRATLLSIMNFIASLIMFIFSPVIGFMAGEFGIEKFFAVAGSISMLLAGVCIRYFFSGKRINKNTEVSG